MKVKKENEKDGLKFNIKKKKKNHANWSRHFVSTRGKRGSSDRFCFLRLPRLLWIVTATMKFKNICSLEGKL